MDGVKVIKLTETTKQLTVSSRYPIDKPLPSFDELRGLFVKKAVETCEQSTNIDIVSAMGLHRWPHRESVAQTHWQIDIQGWIK